MARMRLEPDQPQLYATRTRSPWKLPALVVVVVLVAVVAITRLGESGRPTDIAAGATATPRPSATLARGWSTPSPDPNTYPDGIPLRMGGGAPVYRVSDAINAQVGDQIQVGGWYIDK